MKTLFASLAALAVASAFAQTQALIDLSRPVFVKEGSLLCHDWRIMRMADIDAFRAPKDAWPEILRRYGCEIVGSRRKVELVTPAKGSDAANAYEMRGLIGIRWNKPDGTPSSGFVGQISLVN